MTSDLARAVKGSSGFLNGLDPCKGPGHSVFSTAVVNRVVLAPHERMRSGSGLPKQSNKDGHWQ